MKLPSASLGFKLNLALLTFVLVLGAATSAIVVYGFNRTQDDASERSQEALEEQGKLALKAVAGGVADSGVIQFETAAGIGQRASRFMQDFRAAGGTPVFDSSRFVQTENGVWYDPSPNRISDVVVVNGGRPSDEEVLDEIAYSAALDPLYAALTEGFPGELGGNAYHPIAIIYVSVSGVGRSYPPIGIQDETPAEVNVSTFYDRFGPVANPARETVWTTPYEDQRGAGLVMTAQTPVYEGDTFRGIFEVDLSIDRLVDLVNGLKPTPGGFTFYVDPEGGILQTDAHDLLTREAETSEPLAAMLEAMRDPPAQLDVPVETIILDGEPYFVAYSPMELPGGSLGVAAPVAEVTAEAAPIAAGIADEGDRTFAIMLAAMGALFVASLVGVTFLNRALLLVPLRRIFAGTRAVAAGDLDTRVDLRRSDELGALADSFNTMVERLRESERNLERQVEERTAKLTVLLDVSRGLGSTLEPEPLLELVLDHVHPLIGCEGAGVSLIEGNTMRQLAVRRPADLPDANEISPPVAMPGESDPILRHSLAGNPLIVPDVLAATPEAAAFRAAWGGDLEGTPVSYLRAFMTVPLISKGTTIGVLNFGSSQPGFFSAEHAQLVEGIAASAAAAIQNARLFKQTQTQASEMAALANVSSAIASTLDQRELLGVILDHLGSVMQHTGSTILLNRDHGFEVVEARSVTGVRADAGALIPYDVSPILAAAMQRGEAVIIDDVRADDPMAEGYRAAISAIGAADQPPFNVIRAWMAVPLALKDRVLGSITISWTEPGYFTEDHARLARAFADQAAVAMENARLHEEAVKVAAVGERQRLARELHDSVSQALYGIALGAQTARKLLDQDPAKAVEPVEYVMSLASAGMAEMRSLIFELRPESLAEEGLVAALQKQIAAAEARYGLTVESELGEEPNVPLEVKEALYRIGQEALHNIVKHAQALNVSVMLSAENGRVQLEIADDGVGFDPAGGYAGHLGLQSMRERAMAVGGTLKIVSGEGKGARLTVTAPFGD